MRIGIDVGGTKIEGVALGDDGVERARHRVATPQAYDDVLTAVVALVGHLESETGTRGSIGIGTPGFLQPGRGLMRNSNLQALNDRPLDRDLAAALGRPVKLDNDASCFVLSEATDGAARVIAGTRRPDVVFGATLGTGVGGGIAIDGRVHSGANGAAAEWSHTTLPFLRDGESPSYRCFCGHPSCIEAFVSGRGLSGAYREATREDLDAPAVGARAVAGDPRVIVLGGGVSNNT
ncbi:MAG TPA: ROK family protein, partial [Polyangia bacterium]|nr:ROK family protein [Polyangia bacterium]